MAGTANRSGNEVFLYEFRSPVLGAQAGELLAQDEADAQRQLRVKSRTPTLPAGLRLYAKSELRSLQHRHLLRVLAAHHRWAEDGHGDRAQLTGLDLSGTSLRGRSLSFADLNGTDLTEADVRDCNLSNANLRGACLRDADLRGANLHNADLSDADLRGANLIGADLEGAELWRANLQGCRIGAKQLHAALGCRSR